jgi:monovalent cation:H+ antiporter-2, CPA2 family
VAGFSKYNNRLQTDASLLRRLQRATQSMEIEWIPLSGDCPLVGRSATQTEIRRQTGASIVTVLHGEETLPNPDPGRFLERGDILAVLGSAEQRARFRNLINVPDADARK